MNVNLDYDWAIEGTRRALQYHEIAFTERDFSYGGPYGGVTGVTFLISDGSEVTVRQYGSGVRRQTDMEVEGLGWWQNLRVLRKLAHDLRLAAPPRQTKRKDGLWKLLRDGS